MGKTPSTLRMINKDGTEKIVYSGLTESQKKAKTNKPKQVAKETLHSNTVEKPVTKKTIKVKDYLRK